MAVSRSTLFAALAALAVVFTVVVVSMDAGGPASLLGKSKAAPPAPVEAKVKASKPVAAAQQVKHAVKHKLGDNDLGVVFSEEGGAADDGGYGFNTIEEDPEAVADANPDMAPNRAVGSMQSLVEHLRDTFNQLLGELKAHEKDANCDGIHAVARSLQQEQEKYKALTIQYDALNRDDQRNVAMYVQDRLDGVSHQAEQLLVSELLRCEQSTTSYSNAIAGIGITQDHVQELTKSLEKHDHDCAKMESLFDEFSDEMSSFYASADRKLQAMRAANQLVAMEKADLELEARMAPTERSFFETYHSLWNRNCRTKVDKALAPKGKAAAK